MGGIETGASGNAIFVGVPPLRAIRRSRATGGGAWKTGQICRYVQYVSIDRVSIIKLSYK